MQQPQQEQDQGQANLFANIDAEVPKVTPPKKGNPCVVIFGAGPEGKRCKTCAHLKAKRYANVYYKCMMRDNGKGGASTDHRLTWPACGKYEEAKAEEENV